MRRVNDVFRTIRNGLAIYGGICLVSGVTMDQLEKKWDRILDKTEDRLNRIFYGKPKERIVEVEYEEVN